MPRSETEKEDHNLCVSLFGWLVALHPICFSAVSTCMQKLGSAYKLFYNHPFFTKNFHQLLF